MTQAVKPPVAAAPRPAAINAQLMHQSSIVPTAAREPVTPKTLPHRAKLANEHDWAAKSLIGVMAAVLAAIILIPVWLSQRPGPTSLPAEVLGESQTRPLVVTVNVTLAGTTQRTLVSPSSGMPAEALAQAAKNFHTEFTYRTNAGAIAVTSFFDHPNGSAGYWQTSINGHILTDLQSQPLRQADTLLLEWIPTNSNA